jgi:hypothetical protein
MRRVGRHVAASWLIAVALVGVDPVSCRAAAAPPAPSTLHHRCLHRHVDPAQAGRRERQFPPHLALGRCSVWRLWRRLGLRAQRHPQAGDRREPGHRHAAAAHRPRGLGRQRAGRELLLGRMERQVVGDAVDQQPAAHVVHARPAASARVPGGADRDLPRRRQNLAQGGLGVHPPGPDADAQLPPDRQGAPGGRAARFRHGLCLQLSQPAGGLRPARSRRRAGST